MNVIKNVMKKPYAAISAAIVFVLMTIWFLNGVSAPPTIATNWQIDVIGTDRVINAGEATDIQLFLEDDMGDPITDANVTVILDMPNMVHHMKKKMNHVEGGLYETEAVVSMGGTWIGMVEASKGSQVFYDQFHLRAEGPIVSKGYRDPTDHINLEQPMPTWVEHQLQ
ncbi:FixH family protein [Desertibacillus haloalkaliphilus]|uniref:FixH family protein n=1 Tax=Desertibacillus haloalkaliphilus TaxID=1328930 RepID=UPI001C276751|nr:FixH family protein [Desertibacillus haloalkaliphilus]MBU8908823.1 FixH family protein [Desertibacillus haloalkaliphilus]